MSVPQPAPAIDSLFQQQGVHVVTHSCTADSGLLAELDPAEYETVRNAIASRQYEFAGGRACAHASLQALGIAPSPLVAASNRSPVWPAAAVGSITHTQGYCFASVSTDQGTSIGIDAEQVGRVTDEVARIALSETEREWVARWEQPDLASTVIFAAKEALYKAQHPVTASWLGFDDVEGAESDQAGLLHLGFVGDGQSPAGIPWPVAARWTLLAPDDGIELVAAVVAIIPC